jgi:DNA polymerase-3 subunit alpha
MKYFTFDCGCKFPIDSDNNSIGFDATIEHISLDCDKTWDLISSGNTKGCFQLESRLGRTMAKKLKPENIEQLSALISIVRPGCLEAMRDGKSVSNHYIDKKNGQEAVDYFHAALEPILKPTYGEMVYQEQAMDITRVIAGFNLQEADLLRKAIGKKKPEEMAKVKLKFLEGSKTTKILNEDQAEEIFSWIEKSQRYSFNKSHSVSYAINAYLSAYTKAHFPKIFFASYLRFAKDKIDPQQEIKELIQNANEMDISVKPPDIRLLNEFFCLDNNTIYFGLTDIKGVGKSVFDKLINIVSSVKIEYNKNGWYAFLIDVLLKINSIAAKALIGSGSLDIFGRSRNTMLFDLSTVSQLTKRELELLRQNINQDLYKALENLLNNSKITKNRNSTIKEIMYTMLHPPFSLEDSAEWISDTENELLGCPITCSKIDMYDITMTNATCRDIKNNIGITNILLAAEIDRIHVVKTKSGKSKGQDMAFLSVVDNTGCLDSVVCFAEQYKQFRHVLFEGNIIIIKGKKSNTKDGIIVEKIFLPTT